MRNLAIAVALFLGLAACSGDSQEVITEPAEEPVTVTVTQTETTEAPAPTEEDTTTEPAETVEVEGAGVGDSINLAGYETGYRVKLVRVKNNPPHEQFFGPRRGKRYWAAYLNVTLTDGSATEVCASNDAAVIDSRGHEFTASIIGSAEPDFGCPNMKTGDKRAGWVTFEVPKKAKLVTFHYTPDAGFAEDTGEWQL